MEERKAIKRSSATSIIRKDSFTMHQRRKPSREKRKRHTLKNKLTYGIVALVLIIVCLFAFSQFYSKNPSSDNQLAPLKAALVDHLSLNPKTKNETFREDCRTILEDTGFRMTYHKGADVTVDFYKNLPMYDYDLIILRVHSAKIEDTKFDPPFTSVGLFTSELYDESKYYDDLVNARLAIARLFEGNQTYFGITHLFIHERMIGRFGSTVIILTGCEGLKYNSTAEAFIQRGAKVYISWTGFVSVSHTDHSTIQLLQNLLQKNQIIKSAIQEISPDPTWPSSELDYYPNEGSEDVGNRKIQDFISSLTTNVAQIRPIFDEPSRSELSYFRGS